MKRVEQREDRATVTLLWGLVALGTGCVAGSTDLSLGRGGGAADAAVPPGPAPDAGAPSFDAGAPPPGCPVLPGGGLRLSSGGFERADLSPALDRALTVQGGVLRVFGLAAGEVLEERDGVIWAGFNDDGSRVVVATESRRGSQLEVVELPSRRDGGDRTAFNVGPCERWLTPDRRFVYWLDGCTPDSSAPDRTLGTLHAVSIAGGGPVTEVLTDPEVLAGSIRSAPDGRALAYPRRSQPATCNCGTSRSYGDLVRAELSAQGSEVRVLARDVDATPISFTADGRLLAEVEGLCACQRQLVLFDDGDASTLGEASPWSVETRVEPLDGRDLWTPGLRPLELGDDGYAVAQVLGHGQGYVRFVWLAGREANLDATLLLPQSSALAVVGSGSSTRVLYFDPALHLGSVEVGAPGAGVDLSGEPVYFPVLTSDDRSAFAFRVELPRDAVWASIWLARPGARPEPLHGEALGPALYGFVPGTSDLLWSESGRLQRGRFAYAGPLEIDTGVYGPGSPVVDRGGCLILYSGGEGELAVRVRNLN